MDSWSSFRQKVVQNSCNIKVTVEEVNLDAYAPNKGKGVWVFDNVLTKEECDALIQMTEDEGYESLEREYDPNYRSNTRVMCQQPVLAAEIFKRVESLLPQEFTSGGDTWKLLGLNDMFRFCRYIPGQKFQGHEDSYFRRNSKERSFYTFMIYLNGGFTGGRTRFITRGGELLYGLQARPGMVLCFQHDIFHDGEELDSGSKYLMRSDVMFQRLD
eukprot:TRINITY_DN13037_c0_g1_i1.p1 TRINITY_DN13037_c0_g1~~TRINITY_DN13037_c0_g1_i1.p1  ORF type:complete len:215 (-),score=23.39 TRINITY_DN13037_c0_g1_i1:36-680(-)